MRIHWLKVCLGQSKGNNKLHHGVREGHEDRIKERASNLKHVFFVLFACSVVISIFLLVGFSRTGIFVVGNCPIK